jgi:glycosyltransferase involved in cell wall biosynthesis
MMTQYIVKVSLEYNTDFTVEANDVYEANAKAEALALESYTVYNSDIEEHCGFDFITGFDPEEVE